MAFSDITAKKGKRKLKPQKKPYSKIHKERRTRSLIVALLQYKDVIDYDDEFEVGSLTAVN